MTSRSFQEQILAHLDPENAKQLVQLDSKSLEQEFQNVIQLLADAPDIRFDEDSESLADQITERVTGNIINLFAPVLAKIESKLKTDNEKLSIPEELSPLPRFDANIPVKKVVKHQGFTLGITHEKNAIRFPYSLPLSAGYGHIRRSFGQAEDKKAIDVYWGGDEAATDVYRVRQLDPDTGFVAEHDYFMGFGGEDAPKAIRDLYHRHLGFQRFGGLEKVDVTELDQYRDSPVIEAHFDADAIPEGHHWVKSDRVKNGGYVRRNWWEKRNDNDSLLWDELRYDAPNQDDWDDSDYIVDHTMQQSGTVFNDWIGQIKDWVGEQGSLEEARDRVAELYSQLDGKKLTQLLEQGMTLADLGGRLAVVNESASDDNEEEADSKAESES